MLTKSQFHPLVFLVAVVICVAQRAVAQSSDQNLPTPVLSNEINGTIRALDIGDPRLTRHFYAFDGTPGDLVITLDSKNLNGDVDVFTAITFRPLTKITMYAETSNQQITKSIYLRSQQILILRVEARSPNDDNGTYHIQFGGSFQPFTGGIPVAEEQTENQNETARQSNVSSVGARIERPAEPVAEIKPPEKPTETEKPTPTPARGSSRNSRTTTRTTRNRPTSRRAPPTKPEAAKTEKPSESKPTEGEDKPATPPEEKPVVTPKTEEKPAAQPAGPRLIIERTDGNRIDRPMSLIRRVVVENSVIVVLFKNGRIERIPMSAVSRMAIEP